MLKQNKGKLIVSSLLILMPALVGFLMWDKLPPEMVTHWGADGVADGKSSRLFAVAGLPLIMLAVHWLCLLITAKDPGNKNRNQKMYALVLWIMPVISIAASAMTYRAALGMPLENSMKFLTLLGLFFVVIGNYLPKCQQNYTIGIKIKWTLANEENWNATHRFGGKVWVIGGVLVIACAFLPEKLMSVIMIPVFVLMVALPMVYSFRYYKKQVKAGTAPEKAVVSIGKLDKQVAVISTIICILVLIGAVVLCMTGDITAECGDDCLTVEASYWKDLSLDYDKMEHIEYRDTCDAGTRTYGFNTPRISMGSFRNDEFGAYTRYTYTQCRACVIITVEDHVLVLNGKDTAATKALYEQLLEKHQAK